MINQINMVLAFLCVMYTDAYLKKNYIFTINSQDKAIYVIFVIFKKTLGGLGAMSSHAIKKKFPTFSVF